MTPCSSSELFVQPGIGGLTDRLGEIVTRVRGFHSQTRAGLQELVDRGSAGNGFFDPREREIRILRGAFTNTGRGATAASTSWKSNGICDGSHPYRSRIAGM